MKFCLTCQPGNILVYEYKEHGDQPGGVPLKLRISTLNINKKPTTPFCLAPKFMQIARKSPAAQRSLIYIEQWYTSLKVNQKRPAPCFSVKRRNLRKHHELGLLVSTADDGRCAAMCRFKKTPAQTVLGAKLPAKLACTRKAVIENSQQIAQIRLNRSRLHISRLKKVRYTFGKPVTAPLRAGQVSNLKLPQIGPGQSWINMVHSHPVSYDVT
jgi:hypothetical protein